MKLRYVTADVFTDVAFGGNPLAVFPDAAGVPDAVMRRIARELNLSESVFVVPPDDPRHTCRLRILTPARELPFAGHPTVGTACVLAALGRAGSEVVFEEGVGPVPVSIRREGALHGATLTAAKLPELTPSPVSSADLVAMLGLSEDDLAGPAQVASCGVPFLVVPVRDRAALGRARLRVDVWERHLSGGPVQEVYPVTRDAADGFALQVRMFSPSMGIAEDPATGGAAAAVAGWLAQSEPRDGRTLRWALSQGTEMGRPSRLLVEADTAGGAVTAVRVGGTTVLMSTGEFDVPGAP